MYCASASDKKKIKKGWNAPKTSCLISLRSVRTQPKSTEVQVGFIFLFLSDLYSEASSLLSYPLPVVVVMEAAKEGGVCKRT